MKKFMVGLLLTTAVQASEIALQRFLNAVTVCPFKTNPLRALKALKGNSFDEMETDDSEVVTATVVYDPRLYNPLIGAPSRIVGRIKVQLTYPAPGYSLVCKTKFEAIAIQ